MARRILGRCFMTVWYSCNESTSSIARWFRRLKLVKVGTSSSRRISRRSSAGRRSSRSTGWHAESRDGAVCNTLSRGHRDSSCASKVWSSIWSSRLAYPSACRDTSACSGSLAQQRTEQLCKKRGAGGDLVSTKCLAGLSDRVALDVMMHQRKAKMQAAACTSQVCVWVRGRWRKWSRGAEKWGCDGNGTTPDPSNEGRPAATAPGTTRLDVFPFFHEESLLGCSMQSNELAGNGVASRA
jgi:hypothetical protein